ncbi:calcium-binding protein, partial [Variovorax sp. YR752]|uniref:beta strand repeat-containing protein n=1 Tax=Variovorax sp. YR752 TaxID=1884383 RepID=UPI003137E936
MSPARSLLSLPTSAVGTLDLIEGDEGDDSLTGTSGNDVLRGQGGNDTLLGGDGDDLIAGGAGNDSLDGGAGFDWLDFSDTGGAVLVNFGGFDGVGTALWAAGEDTLTGFEGIIGSAFDDSMIGSSASNVFIGGAGDDTMHGELGNDRVEYRAAAGAVVIDLAAGYATGGAGHDLLFGFENAYGSDLYGDVLRGENGANELRGFGGNDSLLGGGGNDTLIGGDGDDSVFGEGGEDLLQGGLGDDSYRVDYAVNEHDTIADDGGDSDTLSVDATGFATPSLHRAAGALVLEFFDNIDGQGVTRILEVVDHEGSGRIEAIALVFSLELPTPLLTLADGAAGTASNDAVAGTALADSLTGLAGNDKLWAYLGNDRVDAGSGNDLLFGGAGGDTLVGGSGADTMYGEAGSDVYYVDSASDLVDERVSNGIGGLVDAGGNDSVHVSISQSGATYVLGDYIENLVLEGSASLNGTGNALANRITGNAAANILDGGSGADTLTGGLGNDTYVVNSRLDVISETSTLATEIDTVRSSISFTLGANLEQLTLTGTSALNGSGNALANRISGNGAANLLTGAAGADTLVGGAGNDTMDGGTDNDLYYVQQSGDRVVEATAGSSGGIDTVYSYLSSHTLATNVEYGVVRATGTASLSGNALANRLTGGAGNNALDGGTGVDTMIGGDGSDTYYVRQIGDLVTETNATASSGGTDTVRSYLGSYTLTANVERGVVAVTTTANLTGNGLANLLTGGTGANALNGGAGNDTLVGGAGNDILTGSSGNDVFRFTVAPNASTNVDRITDFSAVYDTIQLENAVFTKLASTGTLSASSFRAGAAVKAMDSNDFVLYDTGTGKLYYDADGSGSGAAVQIALLTGAPAITSA